MQSSSNTPSCRPRREWGSLSGDTAPARDAAVAGMGLPADNEGVARRDSYPGQKPPDDMRSDALQSGQSTVRAG